MNDPHQPDYQCNHTQVRLAGFARPSTRCSTCTQRQSTFPPCCRTGRRVIPVARGGARFAVSRDSPVSRLRVRGGLGPGHVGILLPTEPRLILTDLRHQVVLVLDVESSSEDSSSRVLLYGPFSDPLRTMSNEPRGHSGRCGAPRSGADPGSPPRATKLRQVRGGRLPSQTKQAEQNYKRTNTTVISIPPPLQS